MHHFDPRSLALMACIMAAVMGLLLLGLRRHYPAFIHGLMAWGWAPLVSAGAAAVYSLDRVISEPVAVMLGNVMLHAGFALLLFGSQRFYGLRVTWRFWLGALVVCHAVLAWFIWGTPDYRLRVMLFAAVAAAMALTHARLLVLQSRSFASRFTAAVLLFQAVVLLARAAVAWWVDAPDANRFTPSALQVAYIGVYSFTVLLVSIGAQLMASERMYEEYQYLATHDGLTGALTRRAVLEAARDDLARCQRLGRPFALLMLDIDHFKRINDEHGHLTGDRVLVQCVATLQDHLRPADKLGRYGGEEFVVLMPGVSLQAAAEAAQRLRQAVAQDVEHGAGEPGVAPLPRCTVSIGVAASDVDAISFDALAARADAALYQAKALGRNRVERG